MNKKKNILGIIIICTFLLINCGKYNLTKKVANNSFGTQYFDIIELKQISLVNDTQIIIIADTFNLQDNHTMGNPTPPFTKRCYLLNLIPETKNYSKIIYIHSAQFQEDCEFQDLKYLNYKEIVRKEYNSDPINDKTQLVKIKIRKNWKKYLYIQIENAGNESNKNLKIDIDQTIQKKHNPPYALLYPIVIPYDIVAGSLRSIGYIFYSLALINGALNNNNLPEYRRIPNTILIGTYRTFSYLDDITE